MATRGGKGLGWDAGSGVFCHRGACCCGCGVQVHCVGRSRGGLAAYCSLPQPALWVKDLSCCA
eukprot:1160724-Pelagomonas_calceolata.AAC.4